MAGEEAARVLDAEVALDRGLEQVAERRGQRDREAEDERLAGRHDVLLVEREERDGDRGDACPPTKPSHDFPGEIAGAIRCRPIARPTKNARGVVGEHREQHREDQQAPVVRDRRAGASGSASPPPTHADAEQRHGEPGDGVLARARDEEHEQRGGTASQRIPASSHVVPPSCGAEEREERPT